MKERMSEERLSDLFKLIDEANAPEAMCEPGGNYGLCKTHPTCGSIRAALDALKAEVREKDERIAELNDDFESAMKIAAERGDRMERAESEVARLRATLFKLWRTHEAIHSGCLYKCETIIDDALRSEHKEMTSELLLNTVGADIARLRQHGYEASADRVTLLAQRLEEAREAMRRAQQATGTSTLTYKILEEELSK